MYFFIAFKIGDDGKLLENGIENFSKSIPENYFTEYPTLLNDLKSIAPELLKATDASDAGRIANKFVGELFRTEFDD